MRIFLDTADAAVVRDFERWGCFGGVTTNPLILARAKTTAEQAIPALAEATRGELFAQAQGNTAAELIKDGARLHALCPTRLVIKIPATEHGLEAIHTLHEREIPTAATAIFRASQALCAARAGASYAIPFWHRIAEGGGDPDHEVADAATFLERLFTAGIRCRLLAASLRSADQATSALRAGAYAITISPEVARELLLHPGTQAAVQQFSQRQGQE